MAVMTCYTDVGGSVGEITTSPATLVSSPDKWVEFEERWNSTLESFGLTELHMKKFAHSKGEYESFKWDEPRRRRLLNALMWIMEDCIEYSAAVSVYSDDYRYVDRHYQLSESMRPYTMGCLGCASRVVTWADENNHHKNDLIWIFEKGDQDQNDLRKHWKIAYKDLAVQPIFLNKRDRHLSTEPRRIRPFEAADLIGYENLQAHRLIDRMQGEQRLGDLRKTMQRLFKMSGAQGWGYFGESELISACKDWRIPERQAV